MASTNLSSTTKGHCFVALDHHGQIYQSVKLSILQGLCADLILGHDFLSQHDGLQMSFQGSKPTFSVCGLSTAKVEPASLFSNLLPECKPIATKSRRFSLPDKQFIDAEIHKLLSEDVIEPSKSPWRAQVLVTSDDRHKKRMCVDYSQTINRFTQLDAYSLPRIDEMIEKISEYEIFTTLDLKSAYHQIPIKEEDKPYTAFEAGGNLYQFKRIPFGVTNGVACFQRIIDSMIRNENIKDTFAYLDNVTICGKNQREHDHNFAVFLKSAKDYNIIFNESKSIISAKEIKLLGYLVSKGHIQPDPDRLKPLRDLNEPHNAKSQQRVIDMFAYYSSWIPKFSDKVHPLVKNNIFPLPQEVKESFELLKKEIEMAAITTIDHESPLVVETDASDIAIAATLNQNGRPVAFFSRTLNQSERKHSSVEKEAYAIVEALRKWRHYLIGRHFQLVTDQKSVAFMYGNSPKGKIKNDKIQRWRIEMSCYNYDVVYRPGKENDAADVFSRSYCSSLGINTESLRELHDTLSHPGITRMAHFVKSKNLPYYLEEVKKICLDCKTFRELKPF
ncbi:retrovirus-related pol polyprotein from transposon 17.6 [Plakobranchus ocellatus]|uniref:Retrovirus-related pol polyprotein from transposon 17.6 n=1 Tax=Plakobranchus ocellatus TaxID=259542 RepID=A0AAV4CQ00_9GAST|nr:retrovirus-related pol polyprotein from transposon 17.6 [Plakobranchus ocellatus]